MQPWQQQQQAQRAAEQAQRAAQQAHQDALRHQQMHQRAAQQAHQDALHHQQMHQQAVQHNMMQRHQRPAARSSGAGCARPLVGLLVLAVALFVIYLLVFAH